MPSGFRHPVMLKPEPCRIDCGRVAVLEGVLAEVVLEGEGFPPVSDDDEAPDDDASPDDLAALLPRTPPNTAPRTTMTAIAPPMIHHNRLFRPVCSAASSTGSEGGGYV